MIYLIDNRLFIFSGLESYYNSSSPTLHKRNEFHHLMRFSPPWDFMKNNLSIWIMLILSWYKPMLPCSLNHIKDPIFNSLIKDHSFLLIISMIIEISLLKTTIKTKILINNRLKSCKLWKIFFLVQRHLLYMLEVREKYN